MESEDLEFYKEMEKAKALSMITARVENDQRKSVCSNNVPALKPPPRNQRQQFIPESNYDSGVARPKPCNKSITNLSVEVTPRSNSVPLVGSAINTHPPSFDSHQELIQLSPAISNAQPSNMEFDLRQLDPLFQTDNNKGRLVQKSCTMVADRRGVLFNNPHHTTTPHNLKVTQSIQPSNPINMPPPLPLKAPQAVPKSTWSSFSHQHPFKPPIPEPPGITMPNIHPPNPIHAFGYNPALPINYQPFYKPSSFSRNSYPTMLSDSINAHSVASSPSNEQTFRPISSTEVTTTPAREGTENNDNNLMRFPEARAKIASIYMSLADFDPLFQMSPRLPKQASDHSSPVPLCPRRKSRPSLIDKKAAPPPPPISNHPSNSTHPSHSTQKPHSTNLTQSTIPPISVIPESWNDTSPEDMGSNFEWEDPDDPFSLCHLMMKSQQLQQKQQEQLQQQQQQLQQQQQQLQHKKNVQHQQQQNTSNESSKNILRSKELNPNSLSKEYLQEMPETADEEIQAFLQMVARIKLLHPIDDPYSNGGVIVSVQSMHKSYINMSVKLIVTSESNSEAVTFVCDVNTTVEHVVSQVLSLQTQSILPDNHLLKVFGLSEYLVNDSLLADYAYVQQCIKLGKDIKLIIQHIDYVPRPFLRTMADIEHPVYVPKVLSTDDNSSKLNMGKLNILMKTYYSEVEKMKTSFSQSRSKVTCHGIGQSLKAISVLLSNIETVEVGKAIDRVKAILDTEMSGSNLREACIYECNNQPMSPATKKCYDTTHFVETLNLALDELEEAVKKQVDMFCTTFHKEYRFKSMVNKQKDIREIKDLNECLIIHLASAHRIPNEWKAVHNEFYIQGRLLYGGKQLGGEVWSKGVSLTGTNTALRWDEWLTFDDTRICDLPRECKLLLTLNGCRLVQHSTNEGQSFVKRPLSWVVVQLFNHHYELVQGSNMFGMWAGVCQSTTPTNNTNTHSHQSILLQVDMQNFEQTYVFPKIEEVSRVEEDFEELHPEERSSLLTIIDKDSIEKLSREEREFIWQKRHYLHKHPSALPKILQSTLSWAWYSLGETYMMLMGSLSLTSLQALQLLLPRYSDAIVRNFAVNKLRELPPDEFCHLLPQLIQSLKFEFYHTSALARLLLERSATSIRTAHNVYWLLKEAADDPYHRKRYQLMFGALMSVVGEGMRNEFGKQEEFVNMLSAIADKVKAAKDRDGVLQRELENMWHFLQHKSVRLPINPAYEVAGLDVKSCSYFTSFTVPLKLAFKNIDPAAEDIYVMFKVGDDLRQDMLTLQLIRVMDNLWLREGLDLKMITFRIQPTSLKKGFVELINDSETLGKIQKKHGHGVTGSFKDTPIADWLQMYNSAELEYTTAVDNFMASCAGYCLATYILGVCDRHNDNIMIKHSGHIFHIDFAKFLGDSQMLGAINRDRTPFILTSDMAYVINRGDKPTENFQKFVDLCCRGLNIIRKNSDLFTILLSMMTLSGIPRVDETAPRYVRQALMPERSDAEAVAEFTRMVNTSLKSIFTQFNFFLHNLAQLKFSGHDEGMLLSFIPKTFSLLTDGRITSLELFNIQKRYSPDKFYIYIIKVERQDQRVSSFVLRRFSEFQELHRKLVSTFPLVQWPRLSGGLTLGRSHVKSVADSRKPELEVFLKHLLSLSSEISEHDLIYTFFHPILRDEQENKANLVKLKDLPPSPTTITSVSSNKYTRQVDGAIKLNLFYKPHGFTVMVMHVKDLSNISSGDLPSPYVKMYLMPDPMKVTKRKTKIAKNTSHPTYNEMLIYRMQIAELQNRMLQVMVLSYDGLKENEFLGGVNIRLSELDLCRESIGWHKLHNMQALHNTLF